MLVIIEMRDLSMLPISALKNGAACGPVTYATFHSFL